MAEIKDIHTSLGSGEIAPSVIGRIDHRRYKEGAARLENCIVASDGSVFKRNGTEAVWAMGPSISNNGDTLKHEIKTYTPHSLSERYGARNIDFTLSNGQSYVLCLVNVINTTDTPDSEYVTGFIYSNQTKTFIDYQANDDTPSTLSYKIFVSVTNIPNYNDTGSISFSTNYAFKKIQEGVLTGSERINRLDDPQKWEAVSSQIFQLVDIRTNQPYSYPGYPSSNISGFRRGPLGDWVIKAVDNGVTLWTATSPDGDSNTFPFTNWTGVSNTPTFSTYSVTSGDRISVDDGYRFPFSADELNDIQFDVYKNNLILTHKNHHPLLIRGSNKLNNTNDIDPIRHWSVMDFPFKDGPYLESSLGKKTPLNDDADTSSDTIALSLSLVGDNVTLISTNPTLISGASNLSVNDYIEYTNRGKIFLGKIVNLDNKSEGIIIATPVTPSIDIAHRQSIQESNSIDILTATNIFSDTAIFSKDLEFGVLRHQQISNDGSSLYTAWFRVNRYVGQKNVSTNSSHGTISVATWQQKNNAGVYNSPPSSTSWIFDCLEVSLEAGTIHYCANGVSATGTVEVLSSEESIHLEERTIIYTAKSSKAVFDSSRDIGRFIRIFLNSEPCWGKIIDVTNSRNITIKFDIPPSITKSGRTQYTSTDWQLGSYHNASGSTEDDEAANFPATVSVFDDRIFFGGGNLTPDYFHFSSSESQFSFSPTDENGDVLDTSAISYRLPSGSGEILWASSLTNLVLGTNKAEYKISSSDNLVSLTPDNIYVRKQTEFGSSSGSIANVDGSIVYIQNPGKGVRELTYSFEQDSYRSMNLSVVASHLFGSADKIEDIAYMSYPDNYIIFRTRRGRLICMTYDKENRIVACTNLSIGGLKPYPLSQNHLDIPEWSAFGSYLPNSVVEYSDDYYICILAVGPSATIPPSDPTYWTKLSIETMDDIKIWATGTAFRVGETVENDGIYYQCLKQHTSTEFLNDYSDNLWIHTGAPVISMCVIPSPDDTTSDQLFLTTYRSVTGYDNTGTSLSDTSFSNVRDFVCFETLELSTPPNNDSPYAPEINSRAIHADFHLRVNDNYYDQVNEILILKDGVLRQLHADADPSAVFDNETWHPLYDTLINNHRLYGISVIINGIRTDILDDTAASYDLRPTNIPNSFSNEIGSIIAIYENAYIEEGTDDIFANDDTQLWTNNLGYNIVPHFAFGFTFPCLIKSLPIELYSDGSATLGSVRRIHEVNLRLLSSGEFKTIGDATRTQLEGTYDFTGVIPVPLDKSNERNQHFTIASFNASPLRILGFNVDLQVFR